VRTLLKLNRKWSETGSGRTEGRKDLRRVPRFPPQFSPLSLRFSVRDFVLDYPLRVFISPTCGKIISAQKSTSGSFLYSCHTFRFRVFRLFLFSPSSVLCFWEIEGPASDNEGETRARTPHINVLFVSK